jgi:hypothetical protein
MTELYEDKIEEFIEQHSSFSMKELQAFYKMRTKILHSRINELSKLVENQNEDIKVARDQYADDIIYLKDEVTDIKHMAS